MSLIDSFVGTGATTPPLPESELRESPLNRYFDKVLVINLRRSVARCIRVTQHLQQYGIHFEIMNAVDGRLRTHREGWNKYLAAPMGDHPLEIKQGRKLLTRIGEWGYLLTWKILLRRAIREGWGRILVFEDDVILSHDFNSRVNQWCHNLLKREGNNKPLVIMLGATQLPQHRGPIMPELSAYHPLITDGSFAVGLDQQIYPELLKEVLRMDAPFDSGPLRTIYAHYPKRCFVAWPHLVIADLDSSTIRQRSVGRTESIAQKLEWNLTDFSLDQKNKKLIHIGFTLYDPAFSDTELYKAIRGLLSHEIHNEGLRVNVLVIRGTGAGTGASKLKKEERPDTDKPIWDHSKYKSLFICPKPIDNEGLARRLGQQYWNTLKNSKNKVINHQLFYNTEWCLDREIIWTLPLLMG